MTDILPYSVRVSRRAKRLQLKVHPCGKVEVVVPEGVSQRHVPLFVARHQSWLRQTLARVARHKPAPVTLPDTIELTAVHESWQVEYKPGNRARLVQQPDARRLILHGADEHTTPPLLQQWLTQRAKTVLPPWLEQVSREVGLPYAKVTIRAQKTRWGSCSSRHHISLNRALLFLPPDTARYLFIHELCHTVHMNHSARYWRLVEQLEPHFRRHEQVLRRAAVTGPSWATLPT